MKDKVILEFQDMLSSFITEAENGKNGDKEYNAYQKHFLSIMKKWGIKSINDLKTDEEKKKFFDYVNKSWTSKKEKEKH